MARPLKKICKDWLRSHGNTEAARIIAEKFPEVNDNTVARWRSNRTQIPLHIAQFILDDVEGEVTDWNGEFKWEENEKVRVAMVTNETMKSKTAKCLARLKYLYPDKISFDFITNGTLIYESRNVVAHRFMTQSKADWLLMLDSDIIPPLGHAGQLYQWGARYDSKAMEMDIVSRLMSHGKTLVSALYFTRDGKAMPVYAEGRVNETEAQYARSGPHNEVKPADWVGAGALLIHRNVFQNILEKIPDIQPIPTRPPNYFTHMGDHPEDISFCIRAKRAGHQPHIDLGCMCGHIGEWTFWNEVIAKK